MTAAPACITIDFETKPIKRRPEYPPLPVGCAFRWPGERGFYMAADHPTGNNCTPHDIKAELDRAWHSGLPLLFFNAKFDLAVAYERLGMPKLPWQRVHDAMFLAFLCDPHAKKLGLKNLAEDLLEWPPEERDAVADWVIAHKQQLLQVYPWNRRINKKTGKPVDNITPSEVGRWIFAAPGDVVGPYAIGDVDRTLALHEHLWPIVQDNGMGAAYDRERQVMPIFMENEEVGIRTDLETLGQDVEGYGWHMQTVEDWLRKTLRASGLNFDADADVASVLLDRGVVPEENWQETAGGALSMSKDNLLPEHFTGPGGAEIASALGYRNRLKTCLTMFMQPWLEQASQRGGYISTNWNQTRGGDNGGTRTGRPSTSDPNLLNVSKSWMGRDDGYVPPHFLGVPELPLVRRYLLADEGDTLLDVDFNGQEMRIFAHFEQGALWAQYQQNPRLDVHGYVGSEIKRLVGRELERGKIKVLNFQALFGGGVPAAQRKLKCSLIEAKEYKAFHDRALPGRLILNEEIKRVVRRGDPIRTWGGRLYHVEPPGFSKRHNRHMTYDYKLINYLIQGSAADLTKQAMIDWYNHPKRNGRFVVQVYDEIVTSSPREIALGQLSLLTEIMEQPRISVPMVADPELGANWQEVKAP